MLEYFVELLHLLIFIFELLNLFLLLNQVHLYIAYTYYFHILKYLVLQHLYYMKQYHYNFNNEDQSYLWHNLHKMK